MPAQNQPSPVATPWPEIWSKTSSHNDIYFSRVQGIHIPCDSTSAITRVPVGIITPQHPVSSSPYQTPTFPGTWTQEDGTAQPFTPILHAKHDLPPLQGYYALFARVAATNIPTNQHIGNSSPGRRTCGDVFLLKLNEKECQPETFGKTGIIHRAIYADVPEGLENSDLLAETLKPAQWVSTRPSNIVRLGVSRSQQNVRDEGGEGSSRSQAGPFAGRLHCESSAVDLSFLQRAQEQVERRERERLENEQSKGKRSREEEWEGEERGSAKRNRRGKEERRELTEEEEKAAKEKEEGDPAPKRRGRGRGKKTLEREREREERERMGQEQGTTDWTRVEQERQSLLSAGPSFHQQPHPTRTEAVPSSPGLLIPQVPVIDEWQPMMESSAPHAPLLTQPCSSTETLGMKPMANKEPAAASDDNMSPSWSLIDSAPFLGESSFENAASDDYMPDWSFLDEDAGSALFLGESSFESAGFDDVPG